MATRRLLAQLRLRRLLQERRIPLSPLAAALERPPQPASLLDARVARAFCSLSYEYRQGERSRLVLLSWLFPVLLSSPQVCVAPFVPRTACGIRLGTELRCVDPGNPGGLLFNQECKTIVCARR